MAPRTQKKYKDAEGNPIVIGSLIAQGGEGIIYSVSGNPSVVAKIYKPDVLKKHSKTAKIKAMCNLYDETLAIFSALPKKPVYNSSGKLVGFIMQKIEDYKEIHLLYGIKDRQRYFPTADLDFLIRVAKNYAIAVNALHNKNIVIGDINQGSVMVGKNGMICLIDCDSFQIEYNGKVFSCAVGSPEYTPPELQGMSFNDVTRTQNHDRFGLAVMIFKILMFGRHPYSGKGAPPEIQNAISQGFFCYGRNYQYITPVYTQLVKKILPDEIIGLFERAFSNSSSRPTAKEWIQALDNFKNSLETCPNNCIWCEFAKQGFAPFGTEKTKHKLPKRVVGKTAQTNTSSTKSTTKSTTTQSTTTKSTTTKTSTASNKSAKTSSSKMKYKDSQGNPIALGNNIAIGNDSLIYEVIGNPYAAVKIYKDYKNYDRIAKVKAMCQIYDSTLASFSAFPEKLVYNHNGEVLGFIMPKLVDCKKINLVYGIKDRQKYFPSADYEFLIRVAKNLAVAVDTLHSRNIVIGVIHHDNILVGRNGMIQLIDCDSYTIEYHRKVYTSKFVSPEYTSPELQGMYNSVIKSQNNDNFGLAVMIFKLLMFGKHPYSGVGAPSNIRTAITQGYYCYGYKYGSTSTPIYSYLSQKILSDEIRDLFERAFSNSSRRPTAKEWIQALDNLKNSLETCSYHSCIWCIMAQQGFKPFGNDISKHKFPVITHNKQTNQNNQTVQTNNTTNQTSTSSQNSNTTNQTSTSSQNSNTANQTSTSTQDSDFIAGCLVILFFVAVIAGISVLCFNIFGHKESDVPAVKPSIEKKVYTDSERQKDLRAYKDKLLKDIRTNYKPEKGDDTNLWLLIDKDGEISSSNLSDIKNSKVVDAVKKSSRNDEGVMYYDNLPESYNSEHIKLQFVFNKSGVYYKGEEPAVKKESQPAAKKENQPVAKKEQKPKVIKPDKPKTNTVSAKNNVQSKSAPKTEAPKPTQPKPEKPKPKEKSDLEKSTDYFFE